ncbi:helix-turn-helix domain-containing protein [Actinomadura xylanilytica]|uniref:helix-turn-helix domain-containing protein n=1 Tax=Actinomadura xylanilytica TaxID=887459 RepID=UPI00255AB448|nr:helix-turn-helix transcriptional regulator [Actinomadura xylanilytica]MDL4771639.1 helix-turn-helix transcriptional regulator [Actinomadura xylanilytica]
MLEPEELGQSKKDLAQYLRELRKASGLSGERLAVRSGISQSKISKIETGKVLPALSDVERIIAALDVPQDIAQEITSLVRITHTEFADLRSSLKKGLHRKQGELASFEANASHMRFFLPSMLTGLLHTPEYAKASLETIPGDHSKAIARRIERQAVLYDTSKHFTFILTEQALRWPLCDPVVMAMQVGRIATLAMLPNIVVGVIPLGPRQLSEGPLSTFTLYDESLVTAETFGGAVLMKDPRDIAYHLGLFKVFESYALQREESKAFLATVQSEFIQSRE